MTDDNRGPVYHGGTIHYSHEKAPKATDPLIAAAPKMLAALEQAESFIHAHGSLLASANILKVIRDAIAQAETK